MNTIPVENISKRYLEHAMVIHNFVIKIGNQIKKAVWLLLCSIIKGLSP